MTPRFAARMDHVHRSFIREILKVTERPEVISFAGGLPNPDVFPVEAMRAAADAVLAEEGPASLQYSTTEGHPPLREWIAARYERKGLQVDPDHVLITTGSQQALDLLGKVLLDPGDGVLLERPGYLGAIQSFSLFGPRFSGVDLDGDGPDLARLEQGLARRPKLFYCVPTFQNPSGRTYGPDARRDAAALLAASDTVLVEDDPYGDLRFLGQDSPPLRAFMQGAAGEDGLARSVLLGSFSKITAPGFRLGWMVAPSAIRDKCLIAKQASDLHTATLNQRVMHRFLQDNDLDAHIARIRRVYGAHRDHMVRAMEAHMPPQVSFTRPEGGMFLWAELPDGCSSMELFDLAVGRDVAFVPGAPFFTDGGGAGTLRLNFSNAAPERIEQGIERLAACVRELLG